MFPKAFSHYSHSSLAAACVPCGECRSILSLSLALGWLCFLSLCSFQEVEILLITIVTQKASKRRGRRGVWVGKKKKKQQKLMSRDQKVSDNDVSKRCRIEMKCSSRTSVLSARRKKLETSDEANQRIINAFGERESEWQPTTFSRWKSADLLTSCQPALLSLSLVLCAHIAEFTLVE